MLQSLVSIMFGSCKSKSTASGVIQNKTREAIPSYQTLLHCGICSISVCTQTYHQCKNGHLSCSSCCTRLGRICTLCILGNLKKTKVECKNKSLTLIHSKKLADDKTRCCCPLCAFANSSNKLYEHVRWHRLLITSFTYGAPFSVPAPLELGNKRMILQEEHEGVIFTLCHRMLQDQTARVFSVDCIGQPTRNKAFIYKLSVRCKEGRFSMESKPNVHTNQTKHTSNKGLLIIPSSINGQILVEVCIRKVGRLETS
ncbi:putative E3 ubiquitin-protein ligase SINA-like, plant [Helianthus annuus]|nr:putative E3 ubiquitin-protein ligase SINA-like, plant [Helianthus annuus]